jgi:hypothetical protein
MGMAGELPNPFNIEDGVKFDPSIVSGTELTVVPAEPENASFTLERKISGGLVKIFFGIDPQSLAYNEYALKELKK